MASDTTTDIIDPVIQRLWEVEERYDLLRFTVDGWSVWPRLRLQAYIALAGLPKGTPEPLDIFDRSTRVLRDLCRLRHRTRADFFIKTYSSALADISGSQFKDVFFDDLFDRFSSCFKLEVINNVAFKTISEHAWRRRDLSMDVIWFFSFLPLHVAVSAEISSVAHAMSSLLKNDPDFRWLTASRIAMHLRRHYNLKRIFKWLLVRLRSKCVLTADHMQSDIIAAARELGLPAVEFQHGMINSSNPAYAWSAYARPYKSIMPLPTHLILFGDHWKKQLLATGFWETELLPLGSIRVDQHRSRKKVSRSAKNGISILVTTQSLDTDKIVAFFSEFLRILPPAMSVSLVFKLHPAYEADKSPYHGLMQNARVRVFLGTEAPTTYDLMINADLHVSLSSSCHYEALGFGVPTVVLPFFTHEMVLPLVKTGHARVAATPADLLAMVTQLKDRPAVPRWLGNYYFAENALENIRSHLLAIAR